ncbi:MAG TPA: hypothetical protein VH391_04545 [Solirubrobacterales bacterium]
MNDQERGIRIGSIDGEAVTLGDGTRLELDGDAAHGTVDWLRRGGDAPTEELTVVDAVGAAGAERGAEVMVRTRAQVEWLRLAARWYGEQADRLHGELELARPD